MSEPIKRPGSQYVQLPDGAKNVVDIIQFKSQGEVLVVALDTGVYYLNDGRLVRIPFEGETDA